MFIAFKKLCILDGSILLFMKSVITLKPFEHHKHPQIGIHFKYNDVVKAYVKQYPEVRWSATHKVFYLGYTAEALHQLFQYLQKEGYYVNYTAMRFIKPPVSSIKQKTEGASKMVLYKGLPDEFKLVLKNYISYLRGKRLSEQTITSYGYFVLRFIDSVKSLPIETWTTRHIEHYMETVIAKEQYSISSHRQCVSALKYLTANCQLENFDASHFERPKKGRHLPVVLSKEEVIDMIQVTKNLKHRAIIGLLYSSGLRIGELLNLELRDLDIDRSQIYIKNSKGRKDRTVIMSEVIKPLLLNYINTYAPQRNFVEGFGGERYSDSSVRHFLKQSCQLAGIKKAVTPHTLRHSYATHMMENGVDLRYIQELLGHAKPETTMIYTHVAKKDLMRISSPLDVAVEQLSKADKRDKKVLISRNFKS